MANKLPDLPSIRNAYEDGFLCGLEVKYGDALVRDFIHRSNSYGENTSERQAWFLGFREGKQ